MLWVQSPIADCLWIILLSNTHEFIHEVRKLNQCNSTV